MAWGTARYDGAITHFLQSIQNNHILIRHVQRQDLARVNDQREHTRRDQDGDEEGGNRVEAGPTVPLDEEGGDDHTYGAEGVLSERV
jgi:hypothetical protein